MLPRALAILVAFTAIASAQPTTSNTGYLGKEIQVLEIDDCPATGPMTPDEHFRQGAEHYKRGETLYLQGDYPAAVHEFVDAYCLNPDLYPILKDIGQAYERALDYEKAIAYLERYVTKVPADAKRANACAPDPQVDKDNVASRVNVLGDLRAQVFVQTDPPDAEVTISYKDTGAIAAHGTTGAPIDVFGGTYTLAIKKAGFEPVTQTLSTKIGKPHTVFAKLEPVKGRLAVQVTPGDARMFLDRNFVAIGRYQTKDIKAGTYDLSIEATGFDDQTRRIVVLPDQETNLEIELFPKPQTGRRQAVIFATIAGAIAAGSISNAFSQLGVAGVSGSAGLGAVAGFVGSFFFMPDNIALGTSSLAITSTIAGYLAGTTGAALFSSDASVVAPLGGVTAIVGAVAGYYVGDKARVRPGDAAIINSGVIWGAATGSLFAASFAANDTSTRVSAALTLTGLGMGTVGGVLMSRYFNVSRSHAALIDLGGVAGIIGGLATYAVAYPDAQGDQASAEHLANFAVGGLALGLIGAGILTRNYDTPAIPIAPAFGTAQSATGASTLTFGLGSSW